MKKETIIRLDYLIKHNMSGNAKKLSRTLDISERQVYRYIDYMREDLNAPIEWDSSYFSYVYTKKGRIKFGFQEDKSEIVNTSN